MVRTGNSSLLDKSGFQSCALYVSLHVFGRKSCTHVEFVFFLKEVMVLSLQGWDKESNCMQQYQNCSCSERAFGTWQVLLLYQAAPLRAKLCTSRRRLHWVCISSYPAHHFSWWLGSLPFHRDSSYQPAKALHCPASVPFEQMGCLLHGFPPRFCEQLLFARFCMLMFLRLLPHPSRLSCFLQVIGLMTVCGLMTSTSIFTACFFPSGRISQALRQLLCMGVVQIKWGICSVFPGLGDVTTIHLAN